MPHVWMKRKWRTLCLGSLMIITVVFAACGGANTAGTSAPQPQSAASGQSVNNSTSNGAATSSSLSSTDKTSQKNTSAAPQYLIKTLKVTMEVDDTKKAADDLENWITTTDPQATSAGINYDQAGDTTYNISMTFSVRSITYPQIQRYLRDYAPHKAHLLNFNETVQDVTGDYVDSQSRLKNLRNEQSRLLDLMSHAQALGDVISINQQLTDVEGQIETIEGHINQLTNQTSFYNVSITLQPINTATPPPPPTSGWNPGQTFHDAWAASLSVLQALISFLIWLLAFAIYIVPIALIVWFVRRWRTRPIYRAPQPKAPTAEHVESPPPPVSSGTPQT